MNYYDRQGRRITMKQWMTMWGEGEEGKRRVAFTKVGPYAVSTIYIGLDYMFGRGVAPLIFETMIFDDRREHESVECWRYPTEEAALAGHDQAVAWAREAVSR